jgi:CheY-like chemotaxis protein
MKDDAFREYERASRVISGGSVFGLVALAVFALQAAPSVVGLLSVIGAGLALMGAGAAIGAVIGFLFGIPRQLQEATPSPVTPEGDRASQPGVPYAGNTSLEQISDWLTKIIVGVGLTQLVNVPTALASLGDVVGPALGGFAGSSIFGVLEFLYCTIVGFFAAYLWTRLRLTSLLVESDEEAKRAATHEDELRALEAKTELRAITSPSEIQPTGDKAATAPPSAAFQPREIRLLWVDDRPSNNAREIEQLKAQGIQVITRTDSDDALADLKSGSPKYDAVITDLKRGFDREAGYKFIDAARSMMGDSMPPVIVYTASTNPNVDSDARKRGAIGGTNSPIRLFELVNKALHRPTQPSEEPAKA